MALRRVFSVEYTKIIGNFPLPIHLMLLVCRAGNLPIISTDFGQFEVLFTNNELSCKKTSNSHVTDTKKRFWRY